MVAPQPFKKLEFLDASFEKKENQLFDTVLREVFGAKIVANLSSVLVTLRMRLFLTRDMRTSMLNI